MSASFTPGPWLVHTTNRIVVQADGAFASVTVKDGKVIGDDLPNSICLLRDPGDDFSEDETLANGFLIAAAPELLAVCEDMIPTNVCLTNSNVRDDTVLSLDVTMGDLRRVAAAIAKARSPQ